MFEKVTLFFQGRHTAFIVASLSLGSLMQFIGKLNSDYVHLLLGLGALVFAHSVKEDVLQSR